MRMGRGDSRNGPVWLRATALGLLGVYLVMSAWLLWRSTVLSVFSDEYDWAYSWYELQADHRWAGYLLLPHNLNRMVWTRLAVALDMGVFHGTNWPLIVSGTVALAIIAVILAGQAARAAPEPLKIPAAALSAMLTLVAGNVLDASTPIYVTYTHAAVFAVLALLLSEGAVRSPFGWRGAGAIVCAVAAGFGSGAGLAVWPVMAWGALRRREWPWLGVVVVAGAAYVAFYFAGQLHGAGATTASAADDPKSALILALGYLTLPWTRLILHVAWLVGGLIAAAGLALALLNGGREASPIQHVASGFILFTLATAAMLGLGRSGIGDPYNVPLRYTPLVAPLQTGFVMLAAFHLRAPLRTHLRLAGVALIAALIALLALNVVFAEKVVTASDSIRDLVMDFRAGARTERMLTVIYPSLSFAEQMDARLARDGYFQHELHLTRPAPPLAAPPAAPASHGG